MVRLINLSHIKEVYMETNVLPLGLCKQAFMKLESFMGDVREIMEEENIKPEHKLMFDQMVEMSGNMLAALINIVSTEMDEDLFVAETIDMDEIPEFPEDMSDLLDKEI